jgi:hypothetical protein
LHRSSRLREWHLNSVEQAQCLLVCGVTCHGFCVRLWP